MSKASRRRYLFRKRHSAPKQKKRPVSTASKATYIIAVVSVLAFLGAITTAVVTDGDIIKIFVGLGFCFLAGGIYLFVKSINRVKLDDEPIQARVMAVIASAIVAFPWAYIYIMGMLHE